MFPGIQFKGIFFIKNDFSNRVKKFLEEIVTILSNDGYSVSFSGKGDYLNAKKVVSPELKSKFIERGLQGKSFSIVYESRNECNSFDVRIIEGYVTRIHLTTWYNLLNGEDSYITINTSSEIENFLENLYEWRLYSRFRKIATKNVLVVDANYVSGNLSSIYTLGKFSLINSYKKLKTRQKLLDKVIEYSEYLEFISNNHVRLLEKSGLGTLLRECDEAINIQFKSDKLLELLKENRINPKKWFNNSPKSFFQD